MLNYILNCQIKQFLSNVFDVYDVNMIYPIVINIIDNYNNNNIIYEQLIKNINMLPQFAYYLNAYNTYKHQSSEILRQTRYIFDQLNICDDNNNKILVISNFNYDIANSISLNSLNDIFNLNDLFDVIILYGGLHHSDNTTINKYLIKISKLLKSTGILLLREHDYTNDTKQIINYAHILFNAITGVSLSDNLSEIRNFKSLSDWRELLTSYGFEYSYVSEMQSGDPTRNVLMCFNKSNKLNKIKFNIKSRDLANSYYTTPEWLSVDIIKSYGNFLEHTPWYSYPYFNNICLYWMVFFNSLNVVYKKTNLKYILTSTYTLMNFIIGIILTIIFMQLSLMAIIPRYIYSYLKEDDMIDCMVKNINNNNINNNLLKINKQILLIKQLNNKIHIKIPRYKQFTQIILQLINSNYKIISIANNTHTQIKLIDKHNNNSNKIITKYKKYLLYDYCLDDVNYFILDVAINKLNILVDKFKSDGLTIDYIGDF